MKETKASSKAYIQARDGPADKPYCLVNVSLANGAEQSQVMAELMEAARLDKREIGRLQK